MVRPQKYRETYWLDEVDAQELRRRADDLARDGLLAAAQQLRDRANWLEKDWLHGYD